MADTLLSFGVGKLKELLIQESERLRGAKDQRDELIRELDKLKSFLQDADAKKHTSATVKYYVEEIKEIVLDTEDIVETFLLEEELRETWGILKRIIRLPCILMDRWEIASEMGSISKKISRVTSEIQKVGVQKMIINPSEEYLHPLQERQREMRQTYPRSYENELVGLEEKVKELVGYLVKEDGASQVVSITGMGGIGKTTLAQQIFNHDIVKDHFDGLAWVCVSQQFTRKDVWQTILQNLRPEDQMVSNMSEGELHENIYQVLETQKVLIVFDDIWRGGDWDRIKQIFPHGKGWKILITSRDVNVGLRADPNCYTFKSDFLSPSQSWTLFRRIVFPKEHDAKSKVGGKKEEMGKQMIKHCQGLPLAVKVLGGLLVTKYLHEWEKVYKNIRSHIIGGTSFNDRNISSVNHVLNMSFEELPSYLKHCFLYLALFPEDNKIDVENLSYYWAAEEIVRPSNGLTVREVAEGYIEELVKRNMVMCEREVHTSQVETCHLHDVMRVVCLLKAREENFLQVVDANSAVVNSKSRRFSVHGHEGINDSVREISNPKIRSLFFINIEYNRMSSVLCFTRLRLMRVLDLSYVEFEGGKLPSSIGELIHLRYLSFYMARISHLPFSMRNLKFLLYLNLLVSSSYEENLLGSSVYEVYVPNFLKEMTKLIYLCLPYYIDDKTELELGNLVNLETLLNFSTKCQKVTSVHGMTRLRTLSISLYKDLVVEGLSELRHLENVTVTLCGFGQLQEDPMPILEKLPRLKELTFLMYTFVGKRMVCSAGGFLELRNLHIYGLEELEEWIVEEGSMPSLHTLTIDFCSKLKELPDGLRFVTSLTNLKLCGIDLELWKRVKKGGKDYHKIQHVPFVRLSL